MLSGVARVLRINEDKSTQLVETLKRTDLVGGKSLFLNQTHQVRVIAEGKLTCMAMEKEQFNIHVASVLSKMEKQYVHYRSFIHSVV